MNSFTYNKPTKAAIVYLLLLVLLVLRIGGAVSHYCFDGLEPPVTVHFDNLSGHVEHDAETGHNDIEKQVLSDNLLTKFFDFELLVAIAALFFLVLLPVSNGQGYLQIIAQISNESKNLRPPLRAPPQYS
ncbi:MAG: hypothetical protein QF897_01765 [Gammaproteobacteria bacterium]|nr:hypothetical protein [Gammaproteobacteria bacterium]